MDDARQALKRLKPTLCWHYGSAEISAGRNWLAIVVDGGRWRVRGRADLHDTWRRLGNLLRDRTAYRDHTLELAGLRIEAFAASSAATVELQGFRGHLAAGHLEELYHWLSFCLSEPLGDFFNTDPDSIRPLRLQDGVRLEVFNSFCKVFDLDLTRERAAWLRDALCWVVGPPDGGIRRTLEDDGTGAITLATAVPDRLDRLLLGDGYDEMFYKTDLAILATEIEARLE